MLIKIIIKQGEINNKKEEPQNKIPKEQNKRQAITSIESFSSVGN